DGDGDPSIPMVGDMCMLEGLFYCAPQPNDQTGTPLLCLGGMLTESNQFPLACEGFCNPGETEIDACGGFGYAAACTCLPDNPQPCDGVQLGCGDDTLTLCHNDQVVSGPC